MKDYSICNMTEEQRIAGQKDQDLIYLNVVVKTLGILRALIRGKTGMSYTQPVLYPADSH